MVEKEVAGLHTPVIEAFLDTYCAQHDLNGTMHRIVLSRRGITVARPFLLLSRI